MEKGVYISQSNAVSIREEGGMFCVYAGDDARKVGEFNSIEEAMAIAMDRLAKRVRPMSDAEYAVYRQSVLNDRPLPKPQIVKKTAGELTVDRLEYFAKAEGLTLEQYLVKNPNLYRQYRETVDTRV